MEAKRINSQHNCLERGQVGVWAAVSREVSNRRGGRTGQHETIKFHDTPVSNIKDKELQAGYMRRVTEYILD